MTKLVVLIYSDDTLVGVGTPDSAMRKITRLLTLDGRVVVEHDPWLHNAHTTEALEELATR